MEQRSRPALPAPSTNAGRSRTGPPSRSSPTRASTHPRLDIAERGGGRLWLVYHYFNSKDQVLNELFLERWSLLLAAIEEAEGPRARTARARGGRRFIFESYRTTRTLMKVIIVRGDCARQLVRPHHLERSAVLRRHREDRRRRSAAGEFRSTSLRARLAGLYRCRRAAPHRVDLRRRAGRRRPFRRSKEPVVTEICDGLRAALTEMVDFDRARPMTHLTLRISASSGLPLPPARRRPDVLELLGQVRPRSHPNRESTI